MHCLHLQSLRIYFTIMNFGVGMNRSFNSYKLVFFLLLLAAFTGCDKFDLSGISKATEHAKSWHCSIERAHVPATARIDSFFEKRFSGGRFNGTVLFAENGKIIYEKAFGYANFDTREKLTDQSIFQLASVSKQFTAFSIMLLKERNMLSYEDTIGKYIYGFPYGGITIRQLLTHNSGLPNYMYFAEEFWPDKKIPMKNSDLIWMMKTFKPEKYYDPGKTFFYSNTGYALLATIVEKVSRMHFPDFLRQEVFLPLGMKHTFVLDAEHYPNVESVALGHRPNHRLEAYSYQNGVVGDKGVFSNVEDMFRWDQALYNYVLVGRKCQDEAFMPAYKKRGEDHNYGFGWRLTRHETNGRIVYHGGWWKGYRTYFIRAVDKKRTIIVLSNTSSHTSFTIKEMLDLF